MPLASCYLFLGALAGHVSPRTSNTPAPPAGGSIWATDVPGWMTAIATAGLLIGAVITAIYAAKAFHKQAEEVAILAEESKRAAAERRRAQAASVYIGIPPRSSRLVQPAAYNASSYPVFDVQLWYPGPNGLTNPDDLGMIMPGPVGLNGRQMPYDEAVERAILTFRDAEGVRWVRMPDGTFGEQTGPTARESVLAALGLPIPEPPAAS